MPKKWSEVKWSGSKRNSEKLPSMYWSHLRMRLAYPNPIYVIKYLNKQKYNKRFMCQPKKRNPKSLFQIVDMLWENLYGWCLIVESESTFGWVGERNRNGKTKDGQVIGHRKEWRRKKSVKWACVCMRTCVCVCLLHMYL